MKTYEATQEGREPVRFRAHTFGNAARIALPGYHYTVSAAPGPRPRSRALVVQLADGSRVALGLRHVPADER